MNCFKSRDRETRADTPGFGELLNLVVSYAKQETLDPIRGAGRWLAFGFAAVISLIIGISLLALGTLRLLQYEVFAGATTWSWIPYVIVMVLCASVGIVSLSRIKKDSLHLRDGR